MTDARPGPRWRLDATLATALGVLTVLVVAAIVGPWWYGVDPNAQPDPLGLAWKPPSWSHWAGTDALGRDVLARVLAGARVSLGIAVVASGSAFVVGTLWGLLAGWAGRWLDALLMRVADAVLAIPRVLLLLIVLGFWDARTPLAVGLIIGLTGWMPTSRLVRAEVRAARHAPWVLAARAAGASDARILRVHILPVALGQASVAAALAAAHALMLEAGLAAIGVGIAVPMASWGTLLAGAVTTAQFHWWLFVAAGLPLVAASAAALTVSDVAQRRLDPRRWTT
jgi:peptide/nickel transport system permease protein